MVTLLPLVRIASPSPALRSSNPISEVCGVPDLQLVNGVLICHLLLSNADSVLCIMWKGVGDLDLIFSKQILDQQFLSIDKAREMYRISLVIADGQC
jgi:hypothetical protein